jgi:multiple antibiotic resistance protein
MDSSMLELTEYLKILIAVVVIVNPIGAVPVFVGIAGSQSSVERRRTALTSALAVGVVLSAASLLGDSLLSFFGISISSFRVGGGILLLLLAVSMFHAQQSPSKQIPEEATEAEKKPDIAVVPLAIPLLSGPGAISTVIIYSHQVQGLIHRGMILLICAGVAIIVWVTLRAAIPIGAALGKTGINIVTRLMGLILAAIAVELVVSGLAKLLPGLVSGMAQG